MIAFSSSSSSNSSSADSKLKVKIRRSEASTNNWFIPSSSSATANDEPAELPDLVNSCETVKKITKRKPTSAGLGPVASKKKKPCSTATFFSFGHVSQPNCASLTKPRNKPRRRTRFIPTMVKAPPSIFDRLSINHYDYSDRDSDTSPICNASDLTDSSVTTLRPAELVIVNVEGNVNESNDSKRTQKTICKVPPYIPETLSMVSSPPEKSLPIVKPTVIGPAVSPIRRTLLPKRIPTMISALMNRSSPESNETIPLDLSLK